ncbi:hypothetical protein ACTBV7_004612, partial [Salmonella enterica subsp. enterica]
IVAVFRALTVLLFRNQTMAVVPLQRDAAGQGVVADSEVSFLRASFRKTLLSAVKGRCIVLLRLQIQVPGLAS